MITHNKFIVFCYGVPLSYISDGYSLTTVEVYEDGSYYLAWMHDETGHRGSGTYNIQTDMNYKLAFNALENIDAYL